MAGMVSWAKSLPMHISHLSECEQSMSPKLAPGEFLRIHHLATKRAPAKQMLFLLCYGTVCDDVSRGDG